MGDLGSISGLGRSPGRGHGNPFQYSCLENSTDRGAWQATVHGAAESPTTERLSLIQHTILDKKQSGTEDRLCTTPKNFSAFLCPLRHFAEYPLENNLNPHLANFIITPTQGPSL